MKNFIKRTIDRIRKKPLLVKPVVSCCDVCIRKRAKGKELIFISTIKRDGSGTYILEDNSMSHLDNTEFVMNSLSITNKTYIACEFNSYVVRFKHNS
jgi:hypothetical protein